MQRELVVDLASGDYQVNPITIHASSAQLITAGPSFARMPGRASTWGGGPLAGSRIPGTRRLVFCGYSPQWEGFYVSSLGGGAYIMHRVGVDFICIRGAAYPGIRF